MADRLTGAATLRFRRVRGKVQAHVLEGSHRIVPNCPGKQGQSLEHGFIVVVPGATSTASLAPMRILGVSDFYPPTIGGAEIHLQTLFREFAARGHEASIATFAVEGLPGQEVDAGVHIHRLKGWNRVLRRFYDDPALNFHTPFPDPGVVSTLRRLVRDLRPDVISAQGWMGYSAMAVPDHLRPTLTLTLQDYGFTCPKRTMVYRNQETCSGPALRKCVGCAGEHYGRSRGLALTAGARASRRLLARVDAFIAISSAVRDITLEALPEANDRLVVIPDAIPSDVGRFQGGSRPSFLPDDAYALFVGALGPHKGIDILLEALQLLDGEIPVIAIGPRRHDTPKLPPTMHLIEGLPHEQVMQAWSHCTFGIVPSTWPEPLGLVAIEPMACGKPVIGSAIGGITDIIVHGETGLLVPPEDSQALAAAMRRLWRDPVEREAMGSAGALRARRYEAPTIAQRMESLFADLVGSRSPGISLKSR